METLPKNRVSNTQAPLDEKAIPGLMKSERPKSTALRGASSS